MVRPPENFRAIAKDYVCVRVVNINRMDLNQFPYDYDLTLAILLANPDGHVYHRYGGRTHVFPMRMDTLVDVMSEGLQTHRNYQAAPTPPPTKPPLRTDELILGRLKGRMKPMFGCLHCHYVREARQHLALDAGEWTPDQFWVWPRPSRLGLTMNPVHQSVVAKVTAGSAADKAGIRTGDQLRTLRDQRILTRYDIQWVLEQCPDKAIELPFHLLQEGRDIHGAMRLEAAWKTGDPDEYKWRVRNIFTRHMLKFLPTPGFIGKRLETGELADQGFPDRPFGLRIERLNHGAHLAGLRAGDIVTGAGGSSTFARTEDFYRHCELQRRTGRELRVELIRDGSPMNVRMSQDLLNDSRIDSAPRVDIGFIPQELAADRGLRVGHVNDRGSAERAGLLHGDSIRSVNGRLPRSHAALQAILNTMSPGDLLTIDVTRAGEQLQFSYPLPDEQVRVSELAQLSDTATSAGQELECVVTLRLPPDKHVYSMHRKGFGEPTQLEFRGRGYELVGPTREPRPRDIRTEGLATQWVLEGAIQLKQTVRVTEPGKFLLLLHLYAQVCDDTACHEFRAMIAADGATREFVEFRGDFEKQPLANAP